MKARIPWVLETSMIKIIKTSAGIGLALAIAACSTTPADAGKAGAKPVGEPTAYYGRDRDN
ncbi:hypothetical protein Gbth_080_003 [Gluconobacter thailandicus F149-1 = NBRC 100600]|uniref:hypothetical protein n=1 Tax=Gluconobacter thailandicus TaxID=257438 RepID=UPI0005DD42A7|nr:hypothetical protein [Gluconobacter thailandicus]GAN89232.1 hypothetical protein Gbfr_004_084 [Gluconobacter frateurii M-2]GAN94671.1 hypothetical protein Gbth_080_003 [Gluconobacter thailandicus F149-1 = NBRC 100600]GEL86772.1 hypothetical protein GTH01_11300 [Gluconobacter thailandicus F149-1 = NBRC 100600]